MYKIIFFALLSFVVPHITLAAQPVQNIKTGQNIKLTYKAYWGGFVISKIYSQGYLDAKGYQVEIFYEVTGLASIFSNMKNKVSAQGIFAPDGSLKPLVFENQGSWGNFSFKNRTEFDAGDSRIIAHDYTFEFEKDAKYIPLRDDLKYGPDMASFYLGLTLAEGGLEIGAEEKHQNVFGGFFLLDIAYQCAENKRLKSRRSVYTGDTLVCKFRDSIVDGGFKYINKKKKSRTKKKKSTDTMEPVPLQIWYAKLDEMDHMVPIYSEFSIGWGKVRVYLADVEVTNGENAHWDQLYSQQ